MRGEGGGVAEFRPSQCQYFARHRRSAAKMREMRGALVRNFFLFPHRLVPFTFIADDLNEKNAVTDIQH